MEYGLQLYSVRDITKNGLQDAMQKVADLGYSFVEFAGFFGNSAPEVGRMLRETGLRVSGTHTGWEELTPARITDTILYHKIIGNKNIIIPWADLSDRAKLSAFVATVNQAQPVLAQHGIALSYHNHFINIYSTTPIHQSTHVPERDVVTENYVMVEAGIDALLEANPAAKAIRDAAGSKLII